MSDLSYYGDKIAENKVLLALVIIAFLVIGLKYFPVSDGRFFIIGDDPLRHLSLINSFIANKGIVYPSGIGGDPTAYAAYIYYPPLFHLIIAGISILTQIPPILIQNLVPLFCFIAFFVIIYKILRLFYDDRERPAFAAVLSLIFLPVPAPSPHYVAYFVLIPLAIYFILNIFKENKLSSKESIINSFLLFFTLLALGLAHSQSMEFYFAVISLALILGILAIKEAKVIRSFVIVWLVSALAYFTAFFLFSFITPTFWEAILHFFNLQLLQTAFVNNLEFLYLSTGPNKILVLGVFLAAPLIISGILYWLAPRIEKFKNKIASVGASSNSNNASKPALNGKKPVISVALLWIIFAIIIIVLFYLLFWNIIFNVFQFAGVYLFQPAIPFFARIGAMNGLYSIGFAQRSGLEELTSPYSVGIVLLLIISSYAIFKVLKGKNLEITPDFILLLSFMLPILVTLLIFPFIRISDYLNPLIISRFFYYTFAALAIFSAPFFFKFLDSISKNNLNNWKNAFPFAGLVLLLLFTIMGSVFSASYDVSPAQNAGYQWLIQNTPVKANAPELNFDILGYYHISNFPKNYSLGFFGANVVQIDLNKSGDSYSPVVAVNVFGLKESFSPQIYFNEHAIGPNDEKIFDNGEIAFYKEGS